MDDGSLGASLTGESSGSDFQTLYSTICRGAPPVEHEEIKRVLGAHLVDENEVPCAPLLRWLSMTIATRLRCASPLCAHTLPA